MPASAIALNAAQTFLPDELKGEPPNVEPEGTDLSIWTWEEEGRQLFGIAFQGSSQKPLWYNRFRNEDEMQTHIDNTVAKRLEHFQAKSERAGERKSAGARPNPFTVGDILVSSWGYDQTNVTFYAVTKATARTVELVILLNRVVERHPLYGAKVVPEHPTLGRQLRRWGTTRNLRKTVSFEGGRPSVAVAHYNRAYLWDGKPKTQTYTG
jgi:hypothetical protein